MKPYARGGVSGVTPIRAVKICDTTYKALALQKNHEAGNKFISYVTMAKHLTGWRNGLDTPWLKDAPCHPLPHALTWRRHTRTSSPSALISRASSASATALLFATPIRSRSNLTSQQPSLSSQIGLVALSQQLRGYGQLAQRHRETKSHPHRQCQARLPTQNHNDD